MIASQWAGSATVGGTGCGPSTIPAGGVVVGVTAGVVVGVTAGVVVAVVAGEVVAVMAGDVGVGVTFPPGLLPGWSRATAPRLKTRTSRTATVTPTSQRFLVV